MSGKVERITRDMTLERDVPMRMGDGVHLMERLPPARAQFQPHAVPAHMSVLMSVTP